MEVHTTSFSFCFNSFQLRLHKYKSENAMAELTMREETTESERKMR